MKNKQVLLIANRGEIAGRIARTARRMGIKTIGIYSEPDFASFHTQLCDQAYALGGVTPKESYLDIGKVISIAKKSGATLIHPGYGFLSERSQFVTACKDAGISFVGPSAESMDVMGDKIAARKTVEAAGVPGIPGSKDAVRSVAEIEALAKKIGYPVLLKAAAGGGGKGMRRVNEHSEIKEAFESASREAEKAFGDGSMYLEKFILKPHHVEIQVFGDGKGGGVHLGERECSVQRRHQKVFEETPAPILERFPKTREKMFEASLSLVKHIRYEGAGTLEFIVDEEGNFFFLEMNTRLQVEHPVTEWVTGVDLVEWQILQSLGALKLPENPRRSGASIEVRIYAEDSESFLPAPGEIGTFLAPSGPLVRWDSAFRGPGVVSMHYDPMIAKLSTWGKTREDALGRLRVALTETVILPKELPGGTLSSLKTNIPFLKKLLEHSRIVKGDTTTDLIESDQSLTSFKSEPLTEQEVLALGVLQKNLATEVMVESQSRSSLWKQSSVFEGVKK